MRPGDVPIPKLLTPGTPPYVQIDFSKALTLDEDDLDYAVKELRERQASWLKGMGL